MFGFSAGHLIILLLVVLLFGARRLPELGSALGRGMNAFKKGLEGHDEAEGSSSQKPTRELNHEAKTKAEPEKNQEQPREHQV